jgi:hypothetical protein
MVPAALDCNGALGTARLELDAATLPSIGIAAANVERVSFYLRRPGSANYGWFGADAVGSGGVYGVDVSGVRTDGAEYAHYALIRMRTPNSSGNFEANTLFQGARSVVSCAPLERVWLLP